VGYVPPVSPTVLIRADMEPMLAQLHHLRAIFEVSSWNRRPVPGLPRSLEEYRRQLYGEPGRDWFPTLNFAATTSGVALVAAVLVAIATS